MKLALISDAHLFQTFVKAYDPVFDFKRVLEKIKENNPDALLVAGDMFDYKKTTSIYLRHYEGEGLMLKVRSVLNDFGIPIYAIRGNHEKEEVLRGLTQTVQNFNFVRNDWMKLGNVSIYFMDTHYEGELYEPSAVSQILKQLSSTKVKGKKILLCHESFDPFPNSLPKEAISKVKNVFDWIINGHMHFWNPSAYNLKNVITLPSLLPSRLRLGTYWIEQSTWKKSQKPQLKKRKSPFGFAILDTDNETIAFHSYTPIKIILEISINVSDLSLKEVLDGFRQILDGVATREDKDSLIILPEINGLANFVTSFVSEIFKEYPELNIEDLRNSTTTHIITSSGKIISEPLLDPERLFEEIEEELKTIATELEENTQTKLSIRTLRKVLRSLQDNGLLEKMPPRITLRLENLLSEVIAQIQVEKPETFENDIKSMIKKVKE